MHDELTSLIQDSPESRELSTDHPSLLTWDRFFKQVEKNFSTKGLTPTHETCKFSDGSLATVPVYDIEFMILTLLSDPSLPDNIAEG